MSARYLLSAVAVRERCRRIYEIGLEGRLEFFGIAPDRLGAVADYVVETTRAAYPDLDIPLHGRMRHFDAPGLAALERCLAPRDRTTRARAMIDLVVVSVLLDAGAGAAWRYRDETGRAWARSEGLAVASLRMFLAGAFSADPTDPLRVDGSRLASLQEAEIARGLQAGDDNPLAGLAGRAALLRSLGAALPRPCAIWDGTPRIGADCLLEILLDALGDIWPARLSLDGRPLGDTWPHPALASGDPSLGDHLVPFHKLSQWLAYSLFEALAVGGTEVVAQAELTGLAEYRNGGLFIDLGVLVPRDRRLGAEALGAGSVPVVEWRALTVALLDEVAELVRARLGRTADELPLARILQGGTWAAGRKIAAELRPGGPPPLAVVSDGTVF